MVAEDKTVGVSIRDAVFETNSSSSHAVSVAATDIFDLTFDENALRAGKVVLQKPEAGYADWYRFYLPENKLTFLLISEIEASMTPKWKVFRNEVENLVPQSRLRDYDILPVMRWNFPVIDNAIAHLEGECGLSFEFLLGRALELPDLFATENLRPVSGYLNKIEILKRLLFSSSSFIETEGRYVASPHSISNDMGLERVKPADHYPHDRIEDCEASLRGLEAMVNERKKPK